MLIDTITETSFLDHKIIRDNFSRDASKLIFNYYDSYDRPEEFDPQNIASTFHETEFKYLKFDYDCIDGIDKAETLEEIAEILGEKTTVLGISEEYDFNVGKTVRRLVFNSQF